MLCYVRLGQVRLGQVRLGQVRLGQVRLGQVRLGQVRLGQVRLGQVRLGQVRLGQVRFSLSLSIISLFISKTRPFRCRTNSVLNCRTKSSRTYHLYPSVPKLQGNWINIKKHRHACIIYSQKKINSIKVFLVKNVVCGSYLNHNS